MRVVKSSLFFLLMLMLLASRCTDDPPTLTIMLEPAVLDLKLDEAATVTIRLNRSRNFSSAVTVTLEGETQGLIVEPLTIAATQTQGTLTILAQDGATLGSSFPVVRVKGGGLDKSETLSLRIAVPTVEVVAVSIDGNGDSHQVRQGFGQLTMTIMGKQLMRATAVRLGDLDTQVTVANDGQSLQLSTTVSHGASLASHPLIISTPGGDTTLPDALVVTAITAGPTGNDTAGRGTPEQPYRSLKQALRVWNTGSSIYLLNGSYSTASGEVWAEYSGLPPDSLPTSTLPVGIIITGESSEGVILEGDLGNSSGLVLVGNAEVSRLTLRHFGRALVVGSGTINLQHLNILDNTEGLMVIDHAVVSAAALVLAQNTLAGISAYGEASLHLNDVTVASNGTGVRLFETASLRLSSSNISGNSANGLEAEGVSQLFMQSTEVFDNQPFGTVFAGAALVMRDSKIYQNTEGGAGLYVAGDPSVLDLGTLSEAGDNELYDNTGVQLLDARPDREELNLVFITLSKTSLQGTLLEPNSYVAEGNPYFNEPYFTILGMGNGIRVY